VTSLIFHSIEPWVQDFVVVRQSAFHSNGSDSQSMWESNSTS